MRLFEGGIMMYLRTAWQSLLYRKQSVLITIIAIAVSVFVLLGVEHIRQQAKQSFSQTVSGVDLIVGAPSGDINLLLYTVLGIGAPNKNITWQAYQSIKAQKQVAWTIPISLGDSHKSYRVVGTSNDFFKHYQYANQKAIQFSQGGDFKHVHDVVIGAEVAQQLNYQINSQLVLSHGMTHTAFNEHSDSPFHVVGILSPTGTPVDKTVYTSLQGLDAVHENFVNGVDLGQHKNHQHDHNDEKAKPYNENYQADSVTAFYVGLKNKVATFKLQRFINNYKGEALQAILPGITLSQLWQSMNHFEKILQGISSLVLLASLLGMSAMLIASMREREQELMIFRALGARPSIIILLISLEVLLITLIAIVLAILCLLLAVYFTQDLLAQHYGIYFAESIVNTYTFYGIGLIMMASFVVSLMPAFLAYRKSLNDIN